MQLNLEIEPIPRAPQSRATSFKALITRQYNVTSHGNQLVKNRGAICTDTDRISMSIYLLTFNHAVLSFL